MRQPHHAGDADEPTTQSRFGALHARTYEMELLVSGAVVLGLLQLPPVVRAAFARFRSGLEDGGLRLVVGAGQSYVVFVLYVLIGTFVVHLVMRAYWIGLLGLESVFEHGIRWDRLRKGMGPLTLRTYHERVGTLAHAVDRTDDLCSMVFSFGFLVASIFVYSIVAIGVALVIALAVSGLLLGGRHLWPVFWTVLAGVILLQSVPSALDQQLGAKLDPEGAPSRILDGLVRSGYAVSVIRWTGTTQLTLGSNLSGARVSAILVGVCVLLGLGHITVTLVEAGRLRFDDRDYFPVTLREEGIDPLHYRDRRSPDAIEPATPSIQSLVVEGPYLELVVPYSARRANELIRAGCPDLEPLHHGVFVPRSAETSTPAHVRAAAACLGSLARLRLDGRPLDTGHWDFTLEPGSRLPAAIRFLPTAGLAPGRHELEVVVPGRDATPDDPDPVRHLIPFWS